MVAIAFASTCMLHCKKHAFLPSNIIYIASKITTLSRMERVITLLNHPIHTVAGDLKVQANAS
jgi:hypothetical protein